MVARPAMVAWVRATVARPARGGTGACHRVFGSRIVLHIHYLILNRDFFRSQMTGCLLLLLLLLLSGSQGAAPLRSVGRFDMKTKAAHVGGRVHRVRHDLLHFRFAE